MKFIKMLLLVILINVISICNVNGLSVDNNNIDIEKGKSKEIILSTNIDNVSSISFNLVYTTYDVPASFVVDSKYKDVFTNTKHRIIFNNPVSGKVNLGKIKINSVNNPKDKGGTVNITSVKAFDKDGNVIKNLKPQIITVNIVDESNEDSNKLKEEVKTDKEDNNKEIEDNKDKCLLKSIDSNIVNIKLKDGVFDYSVYIDSSVKELDLKPVLSDDSYKASISSQKIDELKDDKIIITLSKGEDKKIYNIKVNVKEDIEVDDTTVNKESYEYKGKWGLIIGVSLVSLIVLLILSKRK